MLVAADRADDFVADMGEEGFVVKLGDGYAADALNPGTKSRFQSFRCDDVNLIVTVDSEFYNRFVAATSVAMRLNLLEKSDRIALFQAVLYGNECLQISARKPAAFEIPPPLPAE